MSAPTLPRTSENTPSAPQNTQLDRKKRKVWPYVLGGGGAAALVAGVTIANGGSSEGGLILADPVPTSPAAEAQAKPSVAPKTPEAAQTPTAKAGIVPSNLNLCGALTAAAKRHIQATPGVCSVAQGAGQVDPGVIKEALVPFEGASVGAGLWNGPDAQRASQGQPAGHYEVGTYVNQFGWEGVMVNGANGRKYLGACAEGEVILDLSSVSPGLVLGTDINPAPQGPGTCHGLPFAQQVVKQLGI